MMTGLIFAQSAPAPMSETGSTIMTIVAVLLFTWTLVIAPSLYYYVWRSARVKDAERARLIELGFVPPPRGSRWPQAIYCLAVGAGVPIGTFLITWLASQARNAPDHLWVAPTVVSVAAVVASAVVASISFWRADRPSSRPEALASHAGKPPVHADAEALDFAGRHPGRG